MSPGGLTLNNVQANQVITIGYQAKVGPAANFAFGTTTLTNVVTLTGGSTTQTAQASVFVTRQAIQGVTNVPTGAGDGGFSLLLPLLALLVAVWFNRNRIGDMVSAFAGKGTGNKLNKRIAEIRSQEQI